MKKVVIISIVLLNSIVSTAQTDTSKVEQYCQVIATPRLLSNKVSPSILILGKKKVFGGIQGLKQKQERLKNLIRSLMPLIIWAGKAGYLLMLFPFAWEKPRFIILLLKSSFLRIAFSANKSVKV